MFLTDSSHLVNDFVTHTHKSPINCSGVQRTGMR
jgi:hypothetical protein